MRRAYSNMDGETKEELIYNFICTNKTTDDIEISEATDIDVFEVGRICDGLVKKALIRRHHD